MMIKRESEQEIKEIYEKYASLVHRRCLSFLKSEDEAWDATQEVFMRLIDSLPAIKKKGAILSWLYKTSTNYCISLLRKKTGIAFDEELHSGDGCLAAQDKALIIKDVVERLLRPWDRKTQEIVVYTYIDGYNQSEISRLMGIGESTIRRHLTRFRQKSGQFKDE
ncbi:RNA polymerase sigma factor [Fibrobacterota bacterium]